MNSPALNPKNLWKPFFIAAALAFVYATVLVKLGKDWWTDENYSHGLLVPFVIGYIIYLEFDRLKSAADKPLVWFGLILISSALVMLLGGTLGAELYMQRISLVVMLAGIAVYFFGAKVLKPLVVPFSLLLLAIPVPQIVFNRIAFPLQIYASQMAVWGIRLFEVPSVRKGNVIEILPNGATQIIALEVVEACSGIRSLMTLITLALVLAYFTAGNQSRENSLFSFLKNFDFWRTIILMLSAIPIAILTNAARVTATGVLTYHYGSRATESVWHNASGWLVYIAALGLLLLVNFVLRKFSRPKFQTPNHSETGNFIGEVLRPRLKNQLYTLVTVLIIGGVFINWFQQRGEVVPMRKDLSEIPRQIGEWRQKGGEIRFEAGVESILRTTDYTMREFVSRDSTRLANLYIGYYASQRTGATYHSPQNCLPGAGWVMTAPEYVEIKTPSGKTFTANKFIIENGVYNEVLIYWYQGRGRFTASEYTDKINTIWDSVLRQRSDGAMVRVMTSVGGSEAEATIRAIDLAAHTADKLSDFVPE
jgi:exosortase D (VPLPA-CTERM-specific)